MRVPRLRHLAQRPRRQPRYRPRPAHGHSALPTVRAAAELLCVSHGTFAGLVADGEIRPVLARGFGQRRIPRAELDEFVSRLGNNRVRR